MIKSKGCYFVNIANLHGTHDEEMQVTFVLYHALIIHITRTI